MVFSLEALIGFIAILFLVLHIGVRHIPDQPHRFNRLIATVSWSVLSSYVGFDAVKSLFPKAGFNISVWQIIVSSVCVGCYVRSSTVLDGALAIICVFCIATIIPV